MAAICAFAGWASPAMADVSVTYPDADSPNDRALKVLANGDTHRIAPRCGNGGQIELVLSNGTVQLNIQCGDPNELTLGTTGSGDDEMDLRAVSRAAGFTSLIDGALYAFGGDGNDVVRGSAFGETLNSGNWQDTGGSPGADVVYGGGGADRIGGGEGRDRIYGEAGNDLLNGGQGSDRVSGGSGRDGIMEEAFSGGGSDSLLGGAGADRIEGGSGRDTINGGSGNDYLYGQSGSDRLFGGLGNDSLFGGPGKDRLSGGPGRNRLRQ